MNNELMFSSKSNEHFTPLDFLEKVREFYGGWIDLDPASNGVDDSHSRASANYDKELDGLRWEWPGNVFLNPPYSRDLLKPFIAKAIAEYESGHANQILILAPARTDTQWHRSLAAYPRCYITGRLKFHNPSNDGNDAPFPSVLFYLGGNWPKFARHWRDTGEVFFPLWLQDC